MHTLIKGKCYKKNPPKNKKQIQIIPNIIITNEKRKTSLTF